MFNHLAFPARHLHHSHTRILFHRSSHPIKATPPCPPRHFETMQSLLQYRRIGLAVRKQLDNDREKAESLHHPQDLPDVPAPDPSTSASSSSTTSPSAEDSKEEIRRTATAQTQYTARTALGHALAGIHARERTMHEGKGGKVFAVDWEGEHDPLNPRNWSTAYRLWVTLVVASLAFIVGVASSADIAILRQAAADFGVSEVVESLAIGQFHLQIIDQDLTEERIRSLSCRIWSWGGICRPVFRNIGPQCRLYIYYARLYDLHHGFSTRTKHRCPAYLPIPCGRFWSCPTYLCWWLDL